MEHPEGDVVFRHACKMGLEGILEAAGIAVQVGPVARLAQIQKSRGFRRETRGGGGLGSETIAGWRPFSG